jgi:hypothetical protein
MRTALKLVVPALAALLSACGGATTDSTQTGEKQTITVQYPECTRTISGPTARASSQVDRLCVNCSVTDEDYAVDGNPDTYATMEVTEVPGGSGASIRGTDTRAVFPAGTLAGVDIEVTEEQAVAPALFVRTYLDGALQDEYAVQSGTVNGQYSSGRTIFWFETTQPYDAVEFAVGDQPGSQHTTALVHEFCGEVQIREFSFEVPG